MEVLKITFESNSANALAVQASVKVSMQWKAVVMGDYDKLEPALLFTFTLFRGQSLSFSLSLSQLPSPTPLVWGFLYISGLLAGSTPLPQGARSCAWLHSQWRFFFCMYLMCPSPGCLRNKRVFKNFIYSLWFQRLASKILQSSLFCFPTVRWFFSFSFLPALSGVCFSSWFIYYPSLCN